MDKLQKYSKWALTFLSIWKAIVIVTIGISGFVCFLCLLSTGSNPDAAMSIRLDFLKFSIAPGTIDSVPKSLLCAQLLYILTGFFNLYIISMLKKVVTPMAQGLPFDRLVGPAIRKIAWTKLIGDGIAAILQFVNMILTYYCFDLPSLFCNASITGCKLSLNLAPFTTAVMTFCVLFLLSYYGQELQQLSDETL